LIAGSGLRFVERGTVALPDAPESLSVYVLAP
jgi:hypothetical protein